jgi:hypothetical protein
MRAIFGKVDFWIISFLVFVLAKSAFSFAGFGTNKFYFVGDLLYKELS